MLSSDRFCARAPNRNPDPAPKRPTAACASLLTTRYQLVKEPAAPEPEAASARTRAAKEPGLHEPDCPT
jgi:hypothetical protein